MLKRLLKLWQPIVRFPTYFMVPQQFIAVPKWSILADSGGKSRAYGSALHLSAWLPGAGREVHEIISNKSKFARFHAHILAKFINAPSM